MKSIIRRCGCGRYTMADRCPFCGSPVEPVIPPRFSPEDRYGEYRRRAKRERNGR
ncbi:MAG: RNA-protein complex protein Nop10 [Thermoplasmata archaeon]|nr:RNA-protein complex protein Nop10 [Thermoplasmata archaeon]